MILFFDTSALVKFFHREKGTDIVVSLITDPHNDVFVSELVRLEFACALHRRFRMKEPRFHHTANNHKLSSYAIYVPPNVYKGSRQ